MRSTIKMQPCLALTARRFAADSSGASAVEYAILVFQIGDSVTGLFEKAEGIYGN